MTVSTSKSRIMAFREQYLIKSKIMVNSKILHQVNAWS